MTTIRQTPDKVNPSTERIDPRVYCKTKLALAAAERITAVAEVFHTFPYRKREEILRVLAGCVDDLRTIHVLPLPAATEGSSPEVTK